MINQTSSPTSSATNASRVRYVRPAGSLRAAEDAYLLQLDLPGVNREGLEVNIEDHELTVVGRRSIGVAEDKKEESLYTEFVQADYRRSFELDPQIDSTKIEARLENGVLTLRLPKSEAVRPRRIEIAD